MKITESTYNTLAEVAGTLIATAIAGAFLMMVGTATCSVYRYVKHSYPVHSLDEGPVSEKK